MAAYRVCVITLVCVSFRGVPRLRDWNDSKGAVMTQTRKAASTIELPAMKNAGSLQISSYHGRVMPQIASQDA